LEKQIRTERFLWRGGGSRRSKVYQVALRPLLVSLVGGASEPLPSNEGWAWTGRFNETGSNSAVVQASSKKRKKIDIADFIRQYSAAKMRDAELQKQTLQFLKDDASYIRYVNRFPLFGRRLDHRRRRARLVENVLSKPTPYSLEENRMLLRQVIPVMDEVQLGKLLTP
jgi:hypothetical protein